MAFRELANVGIQPNFSRVTQGVGAVQAVIDSTNYAYLWGSLDNTNFALIDSFEANALKIIVMPPFIKASGSSTDHTTALGGTTKVLLDGDRKP